MNKAPPTPVSGPYTHKNLNPNETHQRIVVSPEVERLQRECDTLRDEVARLLAEAHDLVCVGKPNLLAIYQTKLGAWELKRLHLQCEIARLKRKLTLIQACVNLGQPVHEIEVEGQLDLEFLEWRTRVAEAVAAFDEAKRRLDHPLEPGPAQELRKLYRMFVKKLHPDLRPDLTENERQLWYRVQEAYDRADVEELQALALVHPSPEGDGPNTLEQLVTERASLQDQVTRLLAEIAAIESQPPFTLRKKLIDPEWLDAARKALDEECALLEAQRAGLKAHVDNALAVAQNGNGFSRN